jgi:hypothetical protein
MAVSREIQQDSQASADVPRGQPLNGACEAKGMWLTMPLEHENNFGN